MVAFTVLLPVRLINFGLRDYGIDNQIGLEPTPDDFVQAMVTVGRQLWRVLRDDGTWWLNLGSSYANKNVESNEMILRDDLTKEEIEYVLGELAKYAKES